jgi:hypothetical protein
VYRTGFPAPRVAGDDYPYTGYPFTGMGWSYDWDPQARSHVGVSEFIIDKGEAVIVGTAIEPSTFCAGIAGARGH